MRDETIAELVDRILTQLGYDTQDQHMQRTGERVQKVLELFAANGDDAHAAELLDAQFDDEHDSLVIVGPIAVTSMCAHHMLPVTGWAWVGYIPNHRVCGLSKLARVVHHYAQQFTVQERVTQQIVNLLQNVLEPLGCMAVIEAEHGCMTIRGVKEPEAVTVTSAVRGVFKTDLDARQEFLALMKQRGK